MANAKTKVDLPEPSWKQQLYAYGFTDADIDEVNEVPLHRFLIKMNVVFGNALKKEVSILLEQQSLKIFKDLAESFIIRDAKFDRKFDSIMDAIDKQTKTVNSLNVKVGKLQKEQKNHGERILALEGRLELLFSQHKFNHPKPER